MPLRPADESIMQIALDQAKLAAEAGEVPVGAVITDGDGRVLAEAGNGPISHNDPTAHAEILCIRRAAEALGNYRLAGCTLYVTLEPCIMCVGAVVHARLDRVVFGAYDPKSGALSSNLDGGALPFTNHHFEVTGGVLETECAGVLLDFFRQRRAES